MKEYPFVVDKLQYRFKKQICFTPTFYRVLCNIKDDNWEEASFTFPNHEHTIKGIVQRAILAFLRELPTMMNVLHPTSNEKTNLILEFEK